MAFAFVQQKEISIASGAGSTLAAPSATVTASNLLWIVTTGPSGAINVVTLSDGGVGNTYNFIGSVNDAPDNRCLNFFYALNAKAGATVITATTSAGWQDGIYVAEYSGGITTFIGGNQAINTLPGAGANAITSGLVNVTSIPALVIGFGCNTAGSAVPTVGTGFTGRTSVWATLANGSLPEDLTAGSLGNVAATWTAGNGANTHLGVVAAFSGGAIVVPTSYMLESTDYF